MELKEMKAAGVKWRQLVSQRASESGKKKWTKDAATFFTRIRKQPNIYFVTNAVLKSKSMLEKICDSFAVGHPEMMSRKQVDRS